MMAFLEGSLPERLLHILVALPPELIYPLVGAGAAVENIFPPVPADTFVVLGAFLAAQGNATALGVFLATWLANTVSALAVYAMGRRWGTAFFQKGLGHWLLRPKQLERLAGLYDAHGSKIIFGSRFLPGFRAVVPVFAGISRLGFFRTAIPLALASAIWYGILVYLGAIFGRNLPVIIRALENINTLLLSIAIAFAAVLAIVWWRTRHAHSSGSPDADSEGT